MLNAHEGLHTAANFLDSVREFNRIGNAPIATDKFHAGKASFYLGMQCEELAEKLTAVANGVVDIEEHKALRQFADNLDKMGGFFKAGFGAGHVLRANRAKLIDADIDLMVVSAGSGMFSTSMFNPAVSAVLQANMAKFPNGVATRDANGKVLKPIGWKAPDIDQFVDPIID